MTLRNLFLTLLIFISYQTYSQNINFSIISIPEELTKNANAVVRLDNHHVTIVSQREKIVQVEKAVTVFNELGDGYSDLSIHYDKRKVIKNVKMIAYDKTGREIKKIKKGDFKDYSATGGSLFTDSRVIHYDYTPTTYPYTIYYSYETKSSNTAFAQGWILNGSYYKSIQNSKFSISYPADTQLVKTERNFEGYDVIKKEGKGFISYEVTNSPAIEKEPYTPGLSSILPHANFAVNKFNLEGIDGMASNYEELGKWAYNHLYKDVGELPESTVEHIRELTKGVTDPLEKAKIVYYYVQDKVRYISVQVGIGGFTPMLAADVDELSYGDCKALSNYTKSLLHAVGVTSYFTELYGGNSKTNMDFNLPGVHGNHVILNLPLEGKDIWLECTSQKIPFGHIAGFTDDRDVVVITPEGGVKKHTRVYDDKENYQNIKGKYRLDADGHIRGEIAMESAGNQFDNHLHFVGASEKEIDKSYKEFWDNINNMTLNKVSINNNKEKGVFEESVSFSAENYGVISGERMIFPVNAFNVIGKAPKRMRDRKLPVEVRRGFFDVDEVSIELPEGYVIEAMNDDKLVETEFGSYLLSIKQESNSLQLKREFLLKTGKYPKESYAAYRDFWREVVRNDKSKIVLVKK